MYAPTQSPIMNLPINKQKKLKINVKIHPTVNNIDVIKIACLLPIEASGPPRGAPIIAPIGTKDEMIELNHSSSFIT